ncbi:MAG: S1C family serine protease [Patescibacteria group bacterium]
MKMRTRFSRIATLTALTILLAVPVFVFTVPYSYAAQNIVDGDLVTVSPNPDIYIVKIIGVKKFKRLILNPDIFDSYGHLKWSNVKMIDQATLDLYKSSELVIEINADGSIADPKVYRVVSSANSDVGERSWLNLTASEFEAAGYDWDSLYHVNHREALPSFYPTKNPLTYQDVLKIKQAPSPSVQVAFSIALVAPNKILAGYATNIVIKGFGFKQGARVDFGSGATQVPYGVTNSEQITALIPAGMPPLTYNLSITNPDGQVAILNDALTLQASTSQIMNGLTTSQVYDLVSPSVVQITNNCDSSLGSGFVFENGGYILTNEHVVHGCSAVGVKLKSGVNLVGTVRGTDALNDVAVVKIDQSIPTLILGDSNLFIDSTVFVAGHPSGLTNVVVNRGVINSSGQPCLTFPLSCSGTWSYLTTLKLAEHGSSGGVLVNDKGEIVGLHRAGTDSVSFAIPINFIKGIIPTLKSGVSTYTPTPTPSPVPTSSPTPATVVALTVTKNSGMADATSSLPTGVKGATNVKIGSFVLTAGAGEATLVSQIVVKNSATAGLALGHDFQNLTLKNGTTVIGSPIGSLSTTASATYTLTPSSSITINAGQQYVVDVYADILTGSANAGVAAYVAVVWDDVTAVGNSTSATAGVATDVIGQTVYISNGGSLVIAAASDMPVAQNRSMGQTGQTLVTFKFTTGASEAVNVSKIIVTNTLSGIAIAATGTITNLGLFKPDGTQVGTYIYYMTTNSGQDALATFNGLTLNLPRDTATVLTLKGDVNGYPNGVSGSAHTFKIATVADVTATGATGGTTIMASGPSITGNAQTVYRSELTVANAMSNSSGGQGTDQVIGKYRFTNTSAGNYTIAVSDINLGLTGSIINTNVSRYVTLKRDSVSGATVAKKVFKNTNLTDITSWDLSGTDSNEVAFIPFTIDSAGGTGYVDFYILADTNDAASTRTISTTLGGGSNVITWGDGVTTGITSLDNKPIPGATITY